MFNVQCSMFDVRCSKGGSPGRIRTVNLPNQSRMHCCCATGLQWTRTPDLHRIDRFCRPTIRLFILCAPTVGLTNGTCTRTAAFTGPDAAVTSWSTLGKSAPARICTSSLRLRRAACRTVTLRELLEIALHAGAAPASAA